MADPTLTGAEFKTQLRQGAPKMGLFINSHSPTLVEQLAHSGYDWLLSICNMDRWTMRSCRQ